MNTLSPERLPKRGFAEMKKGNHREAAYRLLAVNVLYGLTLLLVFAAAVFGPLIFDLSSDSSPWERRVTASNAFLALHSRIWIPIIVACVAVAAHSLLVTHRVAGPREATEIEESASTPAPVA